MSTKPSAMARLVEFCVRHAWPVVGICTLLTAAALVYAVGHFKMTTDTAQLISANLPWRQNGIAFAKAFPEQTDSIIAVIDGKTPELAEQGAQTLTDRLAARKDVVTAVDRPDGGPFWSREGLLLLPLAEGSERHERPDQGPALLRASGGGPQPARGHEQSSDPDRRG